MAATFEIGPLAGLEVAEIVDLIRRTDDPADLDAIIAGLEAELEWAPWPHQVAPPGDWTFWLLMGGRGCGKTDAGAFDMDEHAKGPPCDPRLPGGHRMSIVAPSLGDAAESCVNGPSGLKAHNPGVQMVSTIGGTIVRWPNGAEAKLFGGYTAQDVERFRAGGNRCRVWIEEGAAIPQLERVLEQIPFGHRLGTNPQCVMSTTPKPRAALKRLQNAAAAWAAMGWAPGGVKRWDRVMVTRASTNDNPALEEEVREGLFDLYAGTRLGQQELEGILLDDFQGALWQRDAINKLRIEVPDLPTLGRKVCGVDPSTWGVKALETGIIPDPGEIGRGVETGIVVSGISAKRHVYTLGDYSGRMTPNDWANAAINAYVRWQCTRMAPETNAGGALVLANIQAAVAARRAAGEDLPPIRVLGVRAADGKRARAEPVAGLTEQQRHHMVGTHLLLEDQMCGWDPNESWSPDRLDGFVWSVTALEPWKRNRISGSTAADVRVP